MSKKPRAIAGTLTAGLLVALLSGYIYLENDWPRLYLVVLRECAGQQVCAIDLSNVYSTAWQRAVVFDAGIEPEAQKSIVGKQLSDNCEFRQELFFFDAKGEVVAHHCSGTQHELTYLQLHPKLRFEFSRTRFWSVSRESPWVCVHRSTLAGHEYFGVTPGPCSQPAT